MGSHDPQLLKGVLSMLLLEVLSENPNYGYAIVVRLQESGFEDLTEGTVYPALTRLEKKGLLQSSLVRSDSGPARKYYTPTPPGLQELTRAKEAWADVIANVDQILDSTSPVETASSTKTA